MLRCRRRRAHYCSGVNGLLTPPGEPEAFAAALLELLRDPQLARRMGRAGLEMVDEFGARRMVEEIEGLYEELLGRGTEGLGV